MKPAGTKRAGNFCRSRWWGEDVYALVQRGDSVMIEQLDDGLDLDSALEGHHAEPISTWAGLEHLEGFSVSILADGIVHADRTVHDGSITLDSPASQCVVGLPFTHIVEPLPPGSEGADGSARAVRLIEAAFRIEEDGGIEAGYRAGPSGYCVTPDRR